MAKKSKNAKWEETVPSTYDNFFDKITQKAKEQFVGKIYCGGEEEREIFCIEVPSFAIRFLLQQEGWPIQRFAMFLGPQESFKSAFAVEVVRWHRLQAGNGVQIRVEPKPAPELHRSILEWDDKAMKIQKCMTLEEWQKSLDFWVFQAQRVMDGYTENGKKKPGSGRCFPVCYIVDSLTAGLDEKLYSKMESDGTASRHFSTQAAYMTDYLKYLPTKLDGYPFSWIGINHLKEKQDGTEDRSVPGGKGLLYHESLELELRRGKDVSRVDEKGVIVNMKVVKNSGAPHERLAVEVLWYIDMEDQDPATGHYRQKTWFNWHGASMEILRQLQSSGEGNKTLSNRGGAKQIKALKDLLELHVIEDTRKVWSPILGIKEKQAVSFAEGGEALEEKIKNDKEFKDLLYPLCGIRRRNIFKPGQDFEDQKNEVTARLRASQHDIESKLPLPETETEEAVPEVASPFTAPEQPAQAKAAPEPPPKPHKQTKPVKLAPPTSTGELV